MPPTIVPAAPADLPGIVTLLERNRLPRAGIEAHLSATLVAREGEKIVGSAAVEVYGAAALLRSVAVDETLRGQGLGQQLTRAALDLARRRGVETLYLLTETAGDFFPKFGFRKIARADVEPAVQQSVEFTSACPTNALVMMRDLADG